MAVVPRAYSSPTPSAQVLQTRAGVLAAARTSYSFPRGGWRRQWPVSPNAPAWLAPEYQAMASGTTAERVTAGARWLAGAYERSATIQRVLDQAAVTDPAAAARLREREPGRWQEGASAVGLVLGTPTREFVDLVWTLASCDVWFELVEQRGWTSAQWRSWFDGALIAAIEQYVDAGVAS